MSENAKNISFKSVLLFKKYDMLLSDIRIDRESIPTGLHSYDIRHSDNSWTRPVTIEPFVLANWYGTLLSRSSLPLTDNLDNPNDPYRRVRRTDILSVRENVLLSEWLTAPALTEREVKDILGSEAKRKKQRSRER